MDLNMRYSLRNQNRIKEKLGEIFLNELIESLTACFRGEVITTQDPDIKYPVIRVIKNGKVHLFAVVGRKYDVFNLAYCKTV